MGIAVVSFMARSVREIVPVETKHLWYDQVAGRMLEVNGGKLAFSYEDRVLKVTAAENTILRERVRFGGADVMDWFKANRARHSLEILDGGSGQLTFSFPDAEQDWVEVELDKKQFDYELL